MRELSSLDLQLAFLRREGGPHGVQPLVQLLLDSGKRTQACNELLFAGQWAEAERQCTAAEDGRGALLAQACGARESGDPKAVEALLAAVGEEERRGGAGGGGAGAAVSLLSVLLLATRLKLCRPGAAEAPAPGTVSSQAWLRWASQLLHHAAAVAEQCARPTAAMRAQCEALLRASGHNPPEPASPGWVWLCGLVGRKPTDSQVSKLLASSGSLLVLASEAVQQASLPVARELAARCEAAIAEADRAAAATPHHHAVCTEAASAGYVEAAMGELLLVQSLAAVTQRLQQAWPSGRRDEAYRRLKLLAKELKTALDARREQAAERVMVLLVPETAKLSPDAPELTPRLPLACHPRARASAARQLEGSKGLQQLLLEHFKRVWARTHGTARLLYPSIVCASWRVLGLCGEEGAREMDLNLKQMAEPIFTAKHLPRGKFAPNHRFGKSIGHVGKCLWFANHFARKGDLLQAPSRTDDQPDAHRQPRASTHAHTCTCTCTCTYTLTHAHAHMHQASRSMTDYLAHLDGQREASPPALVCAELLERSCCTMLQLIATEHRQPLWLPGSLVEQHLRGAPAAAPSERGGFEARARRSRAAAAKLKSALQACSPRTRHSLCPAHSAHSAHATLHTLCTLCPRRPIACRRQSAWVCSRGCAPRRAAALRSCTRPSA